LVRFNKTNLVDYCEEDKLQEKYKKVVKALKYARKRAATLQEKLKRAERLTSNKEFGKILDATDSRGREIITAHFREVLKSKNGRRFTFKEKISCLTLLKSSPKSYSIISQIMALPSRSTLNNILKQIKLQAGINPIVVDYIKHISEKISLNERKCIFMFDEMFLTPGNITEKIRRNNLQNIVYF